MSVRLIVLAGLIIVAVGFLLGVSIAPHVVALLR